MVLRTDRPLLVRVSFDATRLSPSVPDRGACSASYAVRSTQYWWTSLADIPASCAKTASTGMGGER